MTGAHPRDVYRERADLASQAAEEWRARADAIANRRGLTFLVGLAAYVTSRTVEPLSVIGLVMAGGLAAVFVHLVLKHRIAKHQHRRHEVLAQLNHEATGRLDRDWDSLPEPDFDDAPEHPFADDLDVLGHASLLALIGGASTRPGKRTIREWLLEPAPITQLRDRHEAVRELTNALDFREELWVHSRMSGPVSQLEIERLLEWAEELPWSLDRTSLRWAMRGLPLVHAVAIAAHVFGFTPYLWVPSLLVSFLVNRSQLPPILRDYSRLSMGERGLRHYGEIVDTAAGNRFEAVLLRRLREGLGAGETPPADALRRLFRLTEMSEARRNPFHIVFDLLFHWDLWVVRALDRWRNEHGHELRAWLDALGEVDALAALAGLAHAHPDWSYPAVHEGPPVEIRATQLGHPLLPPDLAVRNDVSVGPEGRFLLVTGSNMSGKSTLLRAIGLNVVLAGAGAPVCAGSMSMPTVELRTSMRVRDAVDEGVSYFMAGLKRLKEVVDAARAAISRPVLYLLDEILQGTNTAERQIAARSVIRHLLDQHAIGAVTTHDLTLADVEDLAERADEVHFRDDPTAPDEPLHFDYVLRPGIATSTNALKLIELMGIASPEGGAPA